MQISRRSLIQAPAALALASMLPARAWADDEKCPLPVLTPERALQRLQAGNATFDKGTLVPYPIDKATLAKLPICQRPIATIVCCSDSRAGPEQIFQVGLGDLFIVRNAGATAANPQAIGSIEYSVAVLKTPLIVVLGHTHCGASEGATKLVEDPDTKFPGSIPGMIAPLLDAARATEVGIPEGWTDRTTLDNVRRVRDALKAPTQPVLRQPQVDGKLNIVAAVYDIGTGKVTFLDI